MVVLESIASGLLAVHLFVGIFTLIGLFLGLKFILGNKNWEFGNKMAFLGAVGYVFTWIFGLLIYPVFRVAVRASNFDSNIPWATGLFEMKEHIGSIGLLAAIVILFLSQRKCNSHEMKKTYAFLLVALFIITVLKAVIGILLVRLDSI